MDYRGYRIDDLTKDKDRSRRLWVPTVAAAAAAAFGQVLMGISDWGKVVAVAVAALMGLGYGLMWRGVIRTMPTPDPTLQVIDYDQSSRPVIAKAIIGVAVVGMIAAWVWRPHTWTHGYLGIGLGFWVALAAPAIIYTIMHYQRRKPRMDEPADYTAEGLALSRVRPQVLIDAGLSQKSPATRIDIPPAIVQAGRDKAGNPYFDVQVLSGQTLEDYVQKADRLASAWQVGEVDISQPAIGIVRVTAVMHEWERAEPITFRAPTPAELALPIADYMRAVPIGAKWDSDERLTLSLAECNATIGGDPGAGKSNFVNALIGWVAYRPEVEIGFIDLKGGMEAAPWGPRLSAVS